MYRPHQTRDAGGPTGRTSGAHTTTLDARRTAPYLVSPRGITLALTLFALALSGCGKSDTARDTAGDDTGAQGVDYVALQKKAEAFSPATGTPGGTIVLSSFSDPKSFNPITSTETSTSEFTAYMYEGLTRTNGVTRLPEPCLAESWETSADGLVWTFHIRPGVTWSDGVPFSAHDVAFTFNQLIYNKDINPNSARDMFIIEGKEITVTALDSMTVRFTLPVPFAPFLRALSQEILPKHTCAAFVKDGSFSTALSIQTPPAAMIGTGPFMLESYISSQKVVFTRNDRYWMKDSAGTRLPYLERVVYMIVADQNAEVLRFQKGEIDYLAAKGEDYPSLKRGEADGGYLVHRLGPANGSNFLFFNQNTKNDPKTGAPFVEPYKQAWFRNVNFRKAVAHALDKKNMINAVMNGLGYPQWSPKTPSEGYFYNPDVPKYPYNLDTARALLAGEGFADRDGDGILEDSAGHPVSFSFFTNSGNNVRVKLAEIIRKDLETIGFDIHFMQLEFNSLIQKIDNPPYSWDAILLGLTGGDEPHFGMNVWHSASGLHMWFPRQEKPSTAWEARIDSLFVAGVKELDRTKRKAVYDEWQVIAADKLPLIFTVLPERILCINRKFKNINPSLNGGLLHNLERIYLDTE